MDYLGHGCLRHPQSLYGVALGLGVITRVKRHHPSYRAALHQAGKLVVLLPWEGVFWGLGAG